MKASTTLNTRIARHSATTSWMKSSAHSLVGRCELRQWNAATDAVIALLPLQAKPRFAIHTVKALVVHLRTLTLDHDLQPSIAVTRLLPGQPAERSRNSSSDRLER